MKKILVVSFIFLLLFTLYFYVRHPLGAKAIINGHTIRLELAVTATEKEKGLGYRDSLPVNTGMLFVYNHPQRYGFWMKGMKFPLDFIWIDGNKIVDLSQNIPQPINDSMQPVSLAPRMPVDKVLEVNAGVIGRLGVKVGDIVQLSD
jgi:uncharacterized membrane protein (UPF0127 family)